MKRYNQWISLIVIFFISLLYLNPLVVNASQNINAPIIDAQSVVAIDRLTGQIVYQSNRQKPVEVGSITKLLTAYVAYRAFEESNEWDNETVIDISDNAYALSQDYNLSNVPLRQDMDYKLEELIESMAVALANGSALALAEFIAGDEDSFVKMMEAQLAAWGLEGYQLYNCTGLPVDGHTGPTNQLSAEAAAVIVYHLVQDYPQFIEYSQQDKSTFKPRSSDRIEMLNYNYLIPGRPYGYEGVLGLMPGVSPKDGESLVTLAEHNGVDVIICVLGSTKEDQRYDDTVKLIEYTTSTYRRELVVEAGQPVTHLGSVRVEGANQKYAKLQYEHDLEIALPIMDTLPRLVYEFVPDEDQFNEYNNLVAPLSQNEQVGVMYISSSEGQAEFLPSVSGNGVPVVLNEDIVEANWFVKTYGAIERSIDRTMESLRQFFINLFN